MNTRSDLKRFFSSLLAKSFQSTFILIFALSLLGVSPPMVVHSQTQANTPPVITEGDPIGVTMSEDADPYPFSLSLHATDGDVGDTLTWRIQQQADNGLASTGDTGFTVTVGYVPNENYYGSDSFVVEVSDGTDVDTIQVNVTIDERNDPPVAVDDVFYTPVDTKIHFVPADLVGNDLDVDEDTLSVATITNITNGEMAFWWFTPTTGFSGEAGFDYTVSDGQVTDSGHATIHVGGSNTAPSIVETDPYAVTISEDGNPTPFALTLHAVDPDPDETLTWSVQVPATHGTASASGTGTSKTIGYTPVANFHGSDSFQILVSDGDLGDSILVNVTVESVNDLPVADPQTVNIHEVAPLEIHLTGSDVDGDVLSFNVVTEPVHGTLTGTAPDLTYTPTATFTGMDSFTFKVFDGLVDSLPVTINIEAQEPNPAMDEKLITSKVIFNWMDVAGATKYRLDLSTKADFSTLVLSVKTSASWYPYGTALKPVKTYYWRVKAKVGDIWDENWTVYQFESMDPLTAPILTSPAHKWIFMDTRTPQLEWEKVDNAVTYRVQVSKISDFSDIIQKAKVGDLFYLTTKLPYGKYFWRVRALDASGGKGPWSEIRIFKVVAP